MKHRCKLYLKTADFNSRAIGHPGTAVLLIRQGCPKELLGDILHFLILLAASSKFQDGMFLEVRKVELAEKPAGL